MLQYTFSKREKVLMVILAVLLLAALWYVAVYKGCEENYRKAVTATQNAQLEFDTATVKAAKLKTMQAELDKIKASGTVQTVLPAYDNVQSLTAQLNAVLAQAENYTLSFDEPVAGDGGVMRRAVTLTFGCGSYETAKTVVTQLGHQSFRSLIDSVAISQAGASTVRSSSSIVGTVSRGSSSSAYLVSMHLTFYESI